jgi:hypothetical protein
MLFFSCLPDQLEGAVFIEKPPVNLSWVSNSEPDLRGYEIHRSTSSGGTYSKVNSGVQTGTSWQDWNVVAGKTYYYRLRAVDVYGNLSPLSAPSEGVTVSTGDYDADGFSDSFEQSVGSDPLSAASKPKADILALSFDRSLLPVGGMASFSVLGYFASKTGQTLEYDMTCIVEYHSDSSGVISLTSCGNGSGQAEGTAVVWAWQVLNGKTVAASNQAAITVDGTPPFVNVFETQPYDGQGLDEDSNGNGLLDPGEDIDGDRVLDQDKGPTPRVPIDSGIIIRVVDGTVGDNRGVDRQTVQLKINGAAASTQARPVRPNDYHEVDVAWSNTSQFTCDQVVFAELSLSDAAGNALNFREAFRVESLAQHQWALQQRPAQTLRFLPDGQCEVAVTPLPDGINDEALAGAKVVFDCNEPVHPRFGPVGELPPVDIATPAGMPVSIEPVAIFDSPATVFLPAPDAKLTDRNSDGIPDTGLEQYLLYQYTGNPQMPWRETGGVGGWLVDGSRANIYQNTPPAIQAQAIRSIGIQAGLDNLSLAPRPDLRANGAKGSLTISTNAVVSLTISLDAGAQGGQFAEWWIMADTPDGRYFYLRERHGWEKLSQPAAYMRLTTVPSEEIFLGLPPFGPGEYTVCFGVDTNLNGRPDLTWQDTLAVHVIE